MLSWGGDDFFDEPNMPSGLSNIVAIATGYDVSVALRSNGTVVAWGWGNASDVPPGLTNVVAIAAGTDHCLALRNNGTVALWGDDGQTNFAAGLSNVLAVAGGTGCTLALLNDGTVMANTSLPAGVSNVVALATSGAISVVRNDGTVVAQPYSFGIPEDMPPSGLSNVVALAGGANHTLALRSDGTMAAWGAGTPSYWGEPHLGQSTMPTGLRNVMAIAGGGWRSMALYFINPKPFGLSNSEWDPAEGFWGFFSGEPDQSYQIQLSDNLIDWIDALDVCPTTGSFWINDGDAIYYPKTFYRGMAQNYLIAP
jgi:alpha-tubulin suppressor-like RCC1 family protein